MSTVTTTSSAQAPSVGTGHTRVEGRDKVTGAARYAAEVPFAASPTAGWCCPRSPAAVSAPSTPNPSSPCRASSPCWTIATPRT
ncbi:hypothetical protein ACFQ3Z_42690 [Streptomyces nogalater]